jgi:hypothetical protein
MQPVVILLDRSSFIVDRFGRYLTNLHLGVIKQWNADALRVECSAREDTMSNWWMPRRCVPMKDVALRRYARGSREQALIPRFPNGATLPLRRKPHFGAEGTGGTETSHVPRGTESIPVVAASEPGQA